MSKSSEARRNMVPLKNSVEEGPQEVEVIGWRLDPERSMGPVGYFGIYPKSNSKSLKGFKQRGMCSEPHCFLFFFFLKKNTLASVGKWTGKGRRGHVKGQLAGQHSEAEKR